MKNRLLTTTAVGALFALSSVAHAEGWGVRAFGGINWLNGDASASVSHRNTLLSSSFSDGPATYARVAFGSTIRGTLDVDSDTGFVLGGAVGYRWDNGLILEIEGAYRRNKLDFGFGGVAEGFGTARFVNNSTTEFAESFLYGTEGTASGTGDGHVDAWSIMANAWYEFELGNTNWRPYLGGGIGIAWVSLNGRGTITPNFGSETEALASDFIGSFFGGAEGFIGPATQHHINIDAKESGFAWQLGAGIGYEFAPNKQITLDYRYFRGPEIDSVRFAFTSNTDLDLDYDYKAHSLMIGMKAGF